MQSFSGDAGVGLISPHEGVFLSSFLLNQVIAQGPFKKKSLCNIITSQIF